MNHAPQFPTCSACSSTTWRWIAPLGQTLYAQCRACGLVQPVQREAA